MGTDERPPGHSVVARLLARPQGFDLFQAISLLERASVADGSAAGGVPGDVAVQLRSVVTLGFSPSDVSRVSAQESGQGPYTLHTPVLSLAGAHGPLPLSFTELVLARTAARDHATADFLDIFNQRFLAFLYRSRKKHHMGLNGLAPQASPLAACLDALSALGLKAGLRAPQGEVSWLEHAGLMGGAPRSMAGLLAILSGRFGLKVSGQQFCGGWRALEADAVLRLGQRRHGPRLGQTALLGRRVWDQSAGVRLEFEGLSLERLQRLLKGGAEHALLHWVVRRYLAQDLDVEVLLTLAPGTSVPATLGRAQPMRLGWTAWLQSAQPAPAPVRARFRLDDAMPAAA